MAKTKNAQLKDAWPKYSRETALRFLDELEERFNDITSVAIAGQDYQEARSDDRKDVIMCSLLRVIQQQGDGSTGPGNELRKMLEALPEGG